MTSRGAPAPSRLTRAVGLAIVAALLATPVWAQPPAPAAPATQAEGRDPLGRDTPRSSLLGFMSVARAGKNDVAAQYLDTPLRGQPAEELARKLYVVLDSRLPARIDEVSDQPDGRLANPLRPDQDLIATITLADGALDVVLERVRSDGGRPIWLFARRTLDLIPDAYDQVNPVSLDRYLPAVLTGPRIAGIRLFHWLALVLIVPLAFHLLGALNLLWVPAVRRAGLGRLVPPGVGPQRLSGAIRFIVLAVAMRWLVATSDLPLVERQFWWAISVLFMIGAATWLLLHVNASLERYLRNRLQSSGRPDIGSLVRVARWFADGLVILVGVLVVVRRLGGDPTAALAGLGIGGIAVALAAQKTLENVIGGLSLIFDRAVCVGDFLKIGEASGTVDSIGLRSTRIRTLDRTILSVPNGQIASVSIETISARDMFWFRHVIGLRYETTPRQIRAVVGGIVRRLAGHSGVDPASVRARFLRFGPSSLDIEMVAYIVAKDWPHFLEIQEDLLLAVMEVVEQAGTAIAFPTRTVHVAAESTPLAAALQPADRRADAARA
jgi:MscS family membrane protein